MVAPCLPKKSPTRQPLHERRRVPLAIIPISYREWNTLLNNNYGPDPVIEATTEQDDQEDDHEYYIPPPSPDHAMIEKSRLVEVIEGLYIAMVDDEADLPTMRTFDDEPFTHVVQVSYEMPMDDPPPLSQWRREEVPRNEPVEHLRLVCPVSDLHLWPEEAVVGPNELKAARDFLALALQYKRSEWWPEELRRDEEDNQSWRNRYGQQDDDDDDGDDAQFVDLAPDYGLDYSLNGQWNPAEQDRVNVLIVAPTCRAVDVLTILFCYLTFAVDIKPHEIMDLDYCDDVWQKVDIGVWSMIYLHLIGRC